MGEFRVPPSNEAMKQLEEKARKQTEEDLAQLRKKQTQGFTLEQQIEQEYLDRVDPETGEEFIEERE